MPLNGNQVEHWPIEQWKCEQQQQQQLNKKSHCYLFGIKSINSHAIHHIGYIWIHGIHMLWNHGMFTSYFMLSFINIVILLDANKLRSAQPYELSSVSFHQFFDLYYKQSSLGVSRITARVKFYGFSFIILMTFPFDFHIVQVEDTPRIVLIRKYSHFFAKIFRFLRIDKTKKKRTWNLIWAVRANLHVFE